MHLRTRHWAAAAGTAVLVHAGAAGLLLRQPPSTGALSAGVSGIEVSLGPAGGAPGTVAAAAALTEVAEPAERPETVEASEPPIEPVAETAPEATAAPMETAEAADPEEPPEPIAAQASAAEPVQAETAAPRPLEAAEAQTAAEAVAAERIAPEAARPVPVQILPAEPASAEPVRAGARTLEPADMQAVAQPPLPPRRPAPPANRRQPQPQPQPTPAAQASAAPSAIQEAAVDPAQSPSAPGAAGKAGTSDSRQAGDAETDSRGGGTPGEVVDYMARLQAWLERHKEYPRRARMRRIEGTALLYFVMDRQGRVLDYRLQRSAGHRLLDEEVRAMIQRAQPLPEMPASMTQAQLELVVPVQFVLR